MTAELETVLEKVRYASLPQFMDVVIDNPFVRCPICGETLLHIVAIWGDIDSARVLLDAGVEIDLLGEDDFTALHEAISQGHFELAKLLLERGADPTKKCAYGDAYELAAKSDNPAFKDILRD